MNEPSEVCRIYQRRIGDRVSEHSPYSAHVYFLCVVCVCVHMPGGACAPASVEAENHLKYPCSGDIHYSPWVFFRQILPVAWSLQSSLLWLTSAPQHMFVPPPQHWHRRCALLCLTLLFTWAQGFELRFSCLQG